MGACGRDVLLDHGVRLAARRGDVLGVRGAGLLEVLRPDLEAPANEAVVGRAILADELGLRLHEGTGAPLVHAVDPGSQHHPRTGRGDVPQSLDVALSVHADPHALELGAGRDPRELASLLAQVAVRRRGRVHVVADPLHLVEDDGVGRKGGKVGILLVDVLHLLAANAHGIQQEVALVVLNGGTLPLAGDEGRCLGKIRHLGWMEAG
mmetsp:Transcript_51079/g.158225  ORF Transcript_51079/g.158225 Transcript_51079/m.158225 type:complete len:208 (+) Transcript_51079:415-1038(+)